ncbi:L-ascorbate metabolism protein UlaG, beta-lactamase superfamily [Paenibacillus sp. cl141a]|uniref:MBL fold metallo-hydrolase n=1 Tax=Paenibacillus sp. cl141a TaxID=1761877 RepID=UPI0008CBF633|nr:MBL fold metallo-hydrolase [Paenibacillus sp. cl141a]SEK86345.1 L-ascorbate metabolism protein UlaG, beta-lactamase superfamily [Paenibacillus sp. cl141a]
MREQNSSSRGPEQLIDEINRTSTTYGMAAVWFLGQESVVLKGGEVVIYIDPYMSADLERKAGFQRAFPAPLQPEHITNANMVLITHEHDDHMDLGTIAVIAKQNPETAFVAPACCHEAMRGAGVAPEQLFAAVCDEWQQFDGFRLMAIPAAHETLDEHEEFGHRFVGYLVDIQGVLIYHAGDTVVYPGLVERLQAHSIDIGMVPINGGDAFRRKDGIVGNMGFREAAELAAASAFDLTIPMHYDIFPWNGEKPGYFVDYCYENHPYMKTKVMARTERLLYVKAE